VADAAVPTKVATNDETPLEEDDETPPEEDDDDGAVWDHVVQVWDGNGLKDAIKDAAPNTLIELQGDVNVASSIKAPKGKINVRIQSTKGNKFAIRPGSNNKDPTIDFCSMWGGGSGEADYSVRNVRFTGISNINGGITAGPVAVTDELCSVAFQNVDFVQNSCPNGGFVACGLDASAGKVTIKNSRFEENTKTGLSAGPAALNCGKTAVCVVEGTTFKSNTNDGGIGGGAVQIQGTAEFTDVVFESNQAAGKGGAIEVDIYETAQEMKQVTFTNVQFVGNQGDGGVADVYFKKPMDGQYSVLWVEGTLASQTCITPFSCLSENFDGGCPEDARLCAPSAPPTASPRSLYSASCEGIGNEVKCVRVAGCQYNNEVADGASKCNLIDCAAKTSCEDCAYAGCGWQLDTCQDVPGGSKQGEDPCPVQDVSCWTKADMMDDPVAGFCTVFDNEQGTSASASTGQACITSKCLEYGSLDDDCCASTSTATCADGYHYSSQDTCFFGMAQQTCCSQEPVDAKFEMSLQAWIGVIVGVIVFLLVLCCVCAFCMCKRMNQPKQMNDLNNPSFTNPVYSAGGHAQVPVANPFGAPPPAATNNPVMFQPNPESSFQVTIDDDGDAQC
jgi:predicted outer membrane repeat protein